ncbi:MAG: Panacea domain-containing protein [Xenococcaceae cyanobacterium]
MTQITANSIADYIIHFYHQHGDLITNLKLQKLVYYAQAWYLALYDKSLFSEDFQAWISGPVQPQLYERFKKYKWNPISEDAGEIELLQQIEDHLIEVIEVYGKYEAYYLERMTQEETPWLKARGGIPSDRESTAVISKQEMQAFYKTLLDDEEKAQAEVA